MTTFFCPKCKAVIKPDNVNGLYYTCDSCGFIDDSTFDLIMNCVETVKEIEK